MVKGRKNIFTSEIVINASSEINMCILCVLSCIVFMVNN